SHSIHHIVAICDHAILLEGGRIYAEGDPNKVCQIYHELLFTPEQPEAEVMRTGKDSSAAVLEEASCAELTQNASCFSVPSCEPSELEVSVALESGTNNNSSMVRDCASSVNMGRSDQLIPDVSGALPDQGPLAPADPSEAPPAETRMNLSA